MKKSTLSSCQA